MAGSAGHVTLGWVFILKRNESLIKIVCGLKKSSTGYTCVGVAVLPRLALTPGQEYVVREYGGDVMTSGTI